MTMPLLRRLATILSFSIAAAATGASASTPAAKPPPETRLVASPTTIAMARELVASLQLSRSGTVRVVPRGPGPRNVGVEIEGRLVVIPRGNLVAVGEAG